MSRVTVEQLQRITPEELPLDRVLPFALYDERGTLFRPAGRLLRRSDVQRNRRRMRGGYFVDRQETGDQFDPQQRRAALEAVRALPAGEPLPCEVLDHHGRLLAAVGTPMNESLRQVIRYRTVKLGALATLQELTLPTAADEQAAVPIDDGLDEQSLIALPAVMHTTLTQTAPASAEGPAPQPGDHAPRLALTQLRAERQAGVEVYHQALQRYADLAEDALGGRALAAVGAEEMVDDLLRHTAQDPSLAGLLLDLRGLRDGEYLFHHGVNVALLALRVARRLGWQMPQARAAAVAGLLGDVGMLDIADEIRLAPRQLCQQERAEVLRHPLYSASRLYRSGMDPLVCLLTYQMHERADGSGYPHAPDGGRLHPLAQVVAAADVFAAAAAPRPHRPGYSPYDAMVAVLEEARHGRLDRNVVRALLDSMGLFPLGSYVRLSDGVVARVLRTNGSAHTRPVVVPLNRDGRECDTEIDLLHAGVLRVTAALSESAATGVVTPPAELRCAG